jgi:hypothetical protein
MLMARRCSGLRGIGAFSIGVNGWSAERSLPFTIERRGQTGLENWDFG